MRLTNTPQTEQTDFPAFHLKNRSFAMKLHNIYLVFLSTLFFLLTGCSQKEIHLTPAGSVPAASAVAKVSQDDNGNTIVDLKVKHLAKPENLNPAKSVYMVWIQPHGAAPIKQGQLQVNDNLEGELKTPTTYKSFEIFVTAEDSAAVNSPSGQEVLRQDITG
jgi:hypothetical protein